jgi:transcriptional regulator with XRE-family HTH domain
MDDVAIGRLLRSIRVRLRLRQVDVATRAGISQQLVSVVELGALEHCRSPRSGAWAGPSVRRS